MSVFLIERGEGVETKPIKTSYSPTAGTGFVTFDNVKVPARNLMGQENKGIYIILSNFNHERWMMACKLDPRQMYSPLGCRIQLTSPFQAVESESPASSLKSVSSGPINASSSESASSTSLSFD